MYYRHDAGPRCCGIGELLMIARTAVDLIGCGRWDGEGEFKMSVRIERQGNQKRGIPGAGYECNLEFTSSQLLLASSILPHHTDSPPC